MDKKLKNKNIECILFDWDGTLVDSVSIWYEAALEVLEHYKQEAIKKGFDFPVISKKKIIEMIHSGLRTHYKTIGADNSQEVEEIYRKVGLDNLQKVRLHEGVDEFLKELKSLKKYKIGLVTSSIKKYLNIGLKNNDLEDYFDIIVANEDVRRIKPDPEGLYLALDKLKVKKENAIYIGDSYADAGAGEKSGITTIIHYPKVNHRIYTRKEVEDLRADMIIEDIKEVFEIL